jgi:hypothetical protein
MSTPVPTHTILAAIQNELRARKDKRNEFGGYNYRNKESIFEAVKPLLAKYDAYITIVDDMVTIGNRYYIKATATLTTPTGSVSAASFAREADNKKGMDEAQITGASSSYAGKYALCNLLAIDDSSVDPDANNDHGKRLPTLDEVAEILAASNPEELRAIYTALTKRNVAKGYLTDLCKERKEALASLASEEKSDTLA